MATVDDSAKKEPEAALWKRVAVALGPLAVLVLLLVVSPGLLIPEEKQKVEPVYFEAVAVVLAETDTKPRQVRYEGFLDPERRAALRAREASQVMTVKVEAGELVEAGQVLCRLKPLTGARAYDLTSPIAGTVTSVAGGRGARLDEGVPCVTVADTTAMLATAEIPPRHAQILRAGDDAEIRYAAGAAQSTVRVVYPIMERAPESPRIIEAMMPAGSHPRIGEAAEVVVRTGQILPTLIPATALFLDPSRGLVVRVVEGSGPTGVLRTFPVTIVAARDESFYVEGLPEKVRLVIKDPAFPLPEDGETVRIGKVG